MYILINLLDKYIMRKDWHNETIFYLSIIHDIYLRRARGTEKEWLLRDNFYINFTKIDASIANLNFVHSRVCEVIKKKKKHEQLRFSLRLKILFSILDKTQIVSITFITTKVNYAFLWSNLIRSISRIVL